MIAKVSFLENTISTSLVMSESSTAQEKLAVWVAVAVRIIAVEFLTRFCAFWDLLVIFYFDLKVGDHLSSSTSHLPTWIHTEKGVFHKAAILDSSGGRNCCSCGMIFVCASFCAYWDYLFIF